MLLCLGLIWTTAVMNGTTRTATEKVDNAGLHTDKVTLPMNGELYTLNVRCVHITSVTRIDLLN